MLISYDLIGRDETSEDYQRLIAKIKSLGSWAKIHYSVFMLETSSRPAIVRDTLTPYIDKNDKLFVIEVGRAAAWLNLPQDVSDWLTRKL